MLVPTRLAALAAEKAQLETCSQKLWRKSGTPECVATGSDSSTVKMKTDASQGRKRMRVSSNGSLRDRSNRAARLVHAINNCRPRSEEHTSELQSRFGISYAVF